jgi:arylsulfatase A-like enzyme
VLAFALLAVSACGSGGSPAGRGPNVLVISMDSVRRDFVSVYGERSPLAPGEATTPTLERLAADGVAFDHAYSTTSWTLPAHASLFTGAPEMVHGVELDVMALGKERATFPELFAHAGYRTAGFYSGPYLDPRYGFGRGFERYEACYGEALAAAAERARALEADARPESQPARAEAQDEVEKLSHRDRSSANVSDSVLAELARARGDARPWMIFAHYFDPHYDFVPPPPYDRRFDPDYQGSEDGSDLVTNPRISTWAPTVEDPRRRERKISERDMEHVRALYRGEIAWTDGEIGRVIADLEAHGELDRTIVVVLADHGDEFFEHENLGHRKSVFEEVLRIPLVVRYPPKLPRSKRVSGVASIQDVYATLLDLAGIERPEASISRSLVPLSNGEADGKDRWAFGRLVNLMPLPHGSGTTALDTWVDEYFLQWPIKIRRTRRWIGAGPRTAPAMVEEFNSKGRTMRKSDHLLAWIDLEKHPGEELAAYSHDFSDARAKEALARFRSVYEKLSALRKAPSEVAHSTTEDSLLTGLGYAGEESESVGADASLFERLSLPPPGSRE